MAVKYNGANVNDIKYKVGTTTYNVNILKKDDTITWCRPFTYTQGTLPTGVASLVCTRNSTNQPGASTGTVASGGTIYYSDKLYWTATASAGYNSPTVTYYNASHTLNITDSVTGTSYVTAGARISGTYAQGTLPTGVASLTCYRKAWNGSSYSTFTSGTIYYGDTFYWAAAASTGYNNPTLTYYDSSHVYTWTGSQGGSITGVSASGLQAGARITWTANVTRGTGVAKYKYSTDGGTTWSAETTAATVTNLDYATTLTVKGTTASAGYTLSGATATATYSSKNVTVPAATRITWSMAVTMSNYVTGWRYKIDSGSWTNKTATATITGIDYASKITIEGTSKEDAEGYTYGAYQGTGTFGSGAQSSNLSTTLSCTKTRITWSLAVTQSNYISSWTYKIGSGSTVSKTASYTITGIDYADSVVIAATNQSEAPYNYGTPTGTGTFSYGSTATTLASTRSVKSYTLTISATNPSYGTYSVNRTSSPYQGATTGALANGATIYYGDVLTGSASGKGTSYGPWDITSVTAPSVTSTGAATSGNLTVTNNDSHTATLYYNTSSAVGGTSIGSAAASASITKTGLSFNTQYYVSARVSRSRDKYVDATDGSQYSGTDGVTGNVTASFKFKRTTTTDTGTIDSSVVSAKTAPQTTYTITWKYLSAYPDTWTTATESYNYGATPSRTAPSTVTSGNGRKVFANWDNLAIVTANRTITAVYTQQYYATISPSYCTADRATGWYNSGTVITWTANDNYSFGGSAVKDTTTTTISSGTTYSKAPDYVKCSIVGVRCSANKTSGSILAVGTIITYTANSNCAFNSTGTQTTDTAEVALGTTSYSKSADYIYVTVNSTNCTANKSTGWHEYNTQCTWTASTNYAFDNSGNNTSQDNFTSPGSTYSSNANYGYFTVSCTNCTANVSSGWYAVTSSKGVRFTANSGYAFNVDRGRQYVKYGAVPGTLSCFPDYLIMSPPQVTIDQYNGVLVKNPSSNPAAYTDCDEYVDSWSEKYYYLNNVYLRPDDTRFNTPSYHARLRIRLKATGSYTNSAYVEFYINPYST